MSGYSTKPAGSAALRLRDGRALGFIDQGESNGRPLIYFHGHPGSSREGTLLAEVAQRLDVRLISIDRPGIGYSTFKPRRRILDWPDDVTELADHLKLERFSVLGFSGGGPYALACARKIPGRLIGCGVIAGTGTPSAMLSFFAMWVPWILTPIARRRFFTNERQAEATLRRLAKRWPEPDQRSLRNSETSSSMAASLTEAFRQGSRGAAYDGSLLGRSWGFELDHVHCQRVVICHGELDKIVPISQARVIARQLRGSQAVFYPDEGHVSLMVNHGHEVVSAIT